MFSIMFPVIIPTLNTDTEIMKEFIFNCFSSEDLQQIKKALHLQYFKKKIVKLPH